MNARSVAWWRDAIVYQIYPRSFQDSDGDGEGDLAGIRSRLDHLRWLGVDALWVSPIYPSPMADMGYDVSDYLGVHRMFGSLEDADALIAAAHEQGLRVLFDVVPCHTSIEHRWFREHPEWYIWADGNGDGPPNNWLSAFGGPAWSRDERAGRWYLHSFYPEQPDLNWRNPAVREAMAGVLRFWQDRGVDGFRLDALTHLLKDDQLRDNPPATGPPALPQPEYLHAFDPRYSRSPPDIGDAVAALRAGAPEAFLVGEVYLPAAELGPYLEHLDVAFAFELFHTPWNADDIRAAIEAATSAPALWRKLGWVLSNHDFERLPTRVGARNIRAAALLALTLPGVAFLFQGDELGMPDGPGIDPPVDRYGRDAFRHPMRWSDAQPHGGFTTGTPWLPAIAVPGGGVAEQREDPASVLSLYRDLIALRRRLGDGLELIEAEEGVVAYRRGEDHVVALNLSDEPRRVPARGEVLRHTHATSRATPTWTLAPGSGVLLQATW